MVKILEELESRPIELSQFVTTELRRVYENLAYLLALEGRESPRSIPVLFTHLHEKNEEILETILRVITVREFSDQMPIIISALHTGGRRDIDNANEALETSIHSGIKKTLIPLLEDIPISEKIAVEKKRMDLPLNPFMTVEEALVRLLDHDDSITKSLALCSFGEKTSIQPPISRIKEQLQSSDPLVREAATWVLIQLDEPLPAGVEVEGSLPPLEKLLHIRKIPIFEFMAIAHISRERRCSQGEIIVREGDVGDILYLVMDGRLVVIKVLGTQSEMILDYIEGEGFLGERTLFDRQPRSASVIAQTETTLLEIQGELFHSIMEQYPTIPIVISRVLSQRVRSLHHKLERIVDGKGKS